MPSPGVRLLRGFSRTFCPWDCCCCCCCWPLVGGCWAPLKCCCCGCCCVLLFCTTDDAPETVAQSTSTLRRKNTVTKPIQQRSTLPMIIRPGQSHVVGCGRFAVADWQARGPRCTIVAVDALSRGHPLSSGGSCAKIWPFRAIISTAILSPKSFTVHTHTHPCLSGLCAHVKRLPAAPKAAATYIQLLLELVSPGRGDDFLRDRILLRRFRFRFRARLPVVVLIVARARCHFRAGSAIAVLWQQFSLRQCTPGGHVRSGQTDECTARHVAPGCVGGLKAPNSAVKH